MCIVVHLCKSQLEIGLTNLFVAMEDNIIILEFDILWLSGAVLCPLCMLVNIFLTI